MYSQSKGTRDHITAHIAVSATGVVVPPFLIFEKSFASGIYARLVPDNALNGTPPNGYMDSERFGNWVTNIFRPHTKHIRRPILLILDSYVSHLDIKMIDRLIENGIHLFCLPPHTLQIFCNSFTLLYLDLLKCTFQSLLIWLHRPVYEKNKR